MKMLLVTVLLLMSACVPPGAGYGGAGNYNNAGGCVRGKRCGATCIAISKTCHYGKARRRRR
jgi:hypothetical protein